MTRQVDTSTLERAVRLLSEYANSGVPDAVSLECAQVCGKLRDALAQPQPSSPSAGEVQVRDDSNSIPCANCGTPWSQAREHRFEQAYDGEWFCSAECEREHEELGCPFEKSPSNYRLPFALRALAAPQPTPEREVLERRIAEMREHHEGVKKRARARMEEAGDVPVKAYYAKMFDTHSIIAGELEELAALATIPDSGLSGIPAIPDKPTPEREALEALATDWERYSQDQGCHEQWRDCRAACAAELRAALSAPADAGGEP